MSSELPAPGRRALEMADQADLRRRTDELKGTMRGTISAGVGVTVIMGLISTFVELSGDSAWFLGMLWCLVIVWLVVVRRRAGKELREKEAVLNSLGGIDSPMLSEAHEQDSA